LEAITGHPIVAESDPRLFDPTLERAVQAFQSSRSLRRDGIVGTQTFIHLNSAVDDTGTPSLGRSAL
jgi:murein L,D-transpeptidase YcbB/YkuD